MTGEKVGEESPTEHIAAPELAAAVREVVRRQGWKPAAALIEQHWDRFATSDPADLLAAIKALPAEALMETPNLLVAVNYLQHVATGRDPRFFHANPQVAAADGGESGSVLDRLIANTGVVANLRTTGSLDAARAEIAKGRQILEAATDEERAEIARSLPHFVFQWARTLDLAGDDDAPVYIEAYTLADTAEQKALARRAAAALAWQHADRGRHKEASRWVEEAKSSDQPNPRYDAPLHLAEALILLDRRDREGADKALAALEAIESGEYWAAEAWVRVMAATTVAQAVLVEESLERDLARHPEQLVATGANHRYVTLARLALGLMLQYPAPEVDAILVGQEPWERLARGFIAYRGGSARGTRVATEGLTDGSGSPRLTATALMLSAWAGHGLGDVESASLSFGRAHRIITDHALFSVYSVLVADDLLALADLSGLDLPDVLTQDRAVAHTPPVPVEVAKLTRRERQILVALCGDLTMPEIATANFITLNTLKATVRGVYSKLGVHSRREAVDIAYRAGLA